MGTSRRKYEETHRWMTFQVDLQRANPALWVLLGESASKIEHIAGVPLKPSVAKELHQVYLAKGVMATTAIEGNTLTEEQVRKAVDGELVLPKSQAYLKQEVDNIIQECESIWGRSQRNELQALTPMRVSELNKAVLRGLELEPEVVPGEIRGHRVTVGRYLGAPREDCDYLLEKLCAWLPQLAATDLPELRMPFAIIQATIAHLYMAWIHPFGDGNGRTARLIEYQLMILAGLPSPVAHLLSNHYNLTRADYYRQLDNASKSGGDIVPFLIYAAQGLVDGLREQIGTIRDQQLDLAWRDYSREILAANPSSVNGRREAVLRALTEARDWVDIQRVPELSPALAKAFAGMTTKAISRDLNALVEMGLTEKQSSKIRAKVEIISAFLPPRSMT